MRRRFDPLKLGLGGHTLVPITHSADYTGPQLWRCIRCHGVLPNWAISSGFMFVMLGRHCPDLLPAIPATTYRPRSVLG